MDDKDPQTQACQMVGQSAWLPPKIMVRENARTIRVAAASQHTVGDRRGCVLTPESEVRDCPILTSTTPRLKKPVGNRVIQFEYFSS
jgi:hypothetical protein